MKQARRFAWLIMLIANAGLLAWGAMAALVLTTGDCVHRACAERGCGAASGTGAAWRTAASWAAKIAAMA